MMQEVHRHPQQCEKCLFRLSASHFLSQEEFEQIEKHITQLKFKKGELLVKQGTKSQHIIYLTQGIVKHYFEDFHGKTLILAVKSAHHLIGVANLFNDGINISSIAALEDCYACMIDITVFEKILKQNSDFLVNFFRLVSEMFKSTVYDFINLAHKQVNGRIAQIILYFSESIYHSSKFTLCVTRKEIAEFAGASQENVITILSKFHKEGILKVEGRDIEIVDMERLRQISKLG